MRAQRWRTNITIILSFSNWKTDEEKKVVFSLQTTFPLSKPNQTILVYDDYGGRGPAWIYALGRWYDYEFGREHGGAGVYCACGPLHLFPLPFRFTTPGLNILDFNAPNQAPSMFARPPARRPS